MAGTVGPHLHFICMAQFEGLPDFKLVYLIFTGAPPSMREAFDQICRSVQCYPISGAGNRLSAFGGARNGSAGSIVCPFSLYVADLFQHRSTPSVIAALSGRPIFSNWQLTFSRRRLIFDCRCVSHRTLMELQLVGIRIEADSVLRQDLFPKSQRSVWGHHPPFVAQVTAGSRSQWSRPARPAPLPRPRRRGAARRRTAASPGRPPRSAW